jgi:preprotein translocase subunit YajC
MTFLLHSLLFAATSTTAKGKTSSGSSLFSIVFLLLIVAAGYFLFIRPRQARMRQQRAQVSTLGVGSEVMSVGGIMGTIVGITDTTFEVEVADGVVMTFVKRAINARPATVPGSTSPVGDSEGDMPPDPWDEVPDAAGDHDPDAEHGPGTSEHGPGTSEHGTGASEHGAGTPEHGAGADEPGPRGSDGHPPDDETGTGSEGSGSGGR